MNYQGIFGYDVSRWQGSIDFAKMRNSGARFVIIKAGQGNWIDPRFDENWRNAKGVLPRSTYWYFDNRYPPKEQARKYFEIISKDLEGICWLDLEDRQTGIYSGFRNWYDFIEELKSVYPGVRVGIYSGFYYMVEMLSYATSAQKQYFAQFPLWQAWYFNDPFHPLYNTIMTPLPWLEYDILQSGTPAVGHDAGVESLEIDYNQFNGDEAKFTRMFGGAPVLPPVETGETGETGETMTLYKGTVTATVTLQIRNGPGTNYTDIGDLHFGDKLEASEIIGGWWKLTKITRTNGVVVGGGTDSMYAFANSGAYIRTDSVETPPAQTFPNEIGLTLNGVTKQYVLKS